MDDAFERWLQALQKRHLERLTLPEIRRALQALSSLYVERRGKIASGAALDGAGKRAAFALFYAPLHFLLVREIVRALGAADPPPRRILDLGCGTGTSSAAWAQQRGQASFRAPGENPEKESDAVSSHIVGFDVSGWALDEARWNWSLLGVGGRAERADLARAPMPKAGEAVLAAFTLNELDEALRERIRTRLLEAGRKGATVLVVEPLSRRSAPWWDGWAEEFLRAGGRADAWRFPVALPEPLRQLDKAAGLDHSLLTGRTIYLRGGLGAQCGA